MDDAYRALRAAYAFPGQPGWVRPAYDGWSIANLTNSLLAYFGAAHGPVLTEDAAFAAALGGRRKALVLLLDGLGWDNLAAVAARRPAVAELFARAWRRPLTSVAPSTTTAATTTLTTGLPPSQHGVIGFLMYFPEYARIFNMIGFVTPDAAHEALCSFGFDPKSYVGAPTLFTLLQGAGVMTGYYTFTQYAGSGLSQLLYRELPPYPYVALGDMLSTALEVLRVPRPQVQLLYWAELDSIAHSVGAGSAGYATELDMLAGVIERQLLPALDDDTALIITADHGHIDGDDREVIALQEMPDLTACFRMPPAGEGRMTHLFLRPGTEDAARAALADAPALLLTKDEFLAHALLGPPPLQLEQHQ